MDCVGWAVFICDWQHGSAEIPRGTSGIRRSLTYVEYKSRARLLNVVSEFDLPGVGEPNRSRLNESGE